jgi:hypothetical protein
MPKVAGGDTAIGSVTGGNKGHLVMLTECVTVSAKGRVLCVNEMEQNIVIYIGLGNALSILGAVITSVALGTWQAATKLTKVETKVDAFDTRLTGLEGRLDKAFASTSPVALLPKGMHILNVSGLKKYIDNRKCDLLAQCRTRNNLTNPYDVQEAAFRLFDQHDFREFVESAKNAAYTFGVSIETIRRIAGIYFRDICLAKHGFTLEDVDTGSRTKAA